MRGYLQSYPFQRAQQRQGAPIPGGATGHFPRPFSGPAVLYQRVIERSP